MATAELNVPALSKRNRRFGRFEFALLASLVALLIQLLGPVVFRTWQEWPRPGQQIAISPVVTAWDGGQREVRSWIYFPKEYGSDQKFPLLLFLHGAGERGNNLKQVLRNSLPGLLAKGKHLPMMVLSPQCQPDQNWDIDQLLALLDYAQTKYSVDLDRVYVSGFSMGGYGTWELAGKAPERFAAIVPVAGGGNVSAAKKFIKLPIWAFHGDQDRTVPIEQTTMMIEAIKRADGNPRFSILKGEGHGIAGKVFSRGNLYEWLLDQKTETGN